jgi:hypothetical protein
VVFTFFPALEWLPANKAILTWIGLWFFNMSQRSAHFSFRPCLNLSIHHDKEYRQGFLRTFGDLMTWGPQRQYYWPLFVPMVSCGSESHLHGGVDYTQFKGKGNILIFHRCKLLLYIALTIVLRFTNKMLQIQNGPDHQIIHDPPLYQLYLPVP